jgi:hypothetical protein
VAAALKKSGEVSRHCRKACDSYVQAINLTISLSTWNQGDENNSCFIKLKGIHIIAKKKGE